MLNILSTDNIDILRLAEEVPDSLDPGLVTESAERHDSDAEHTHAEISKAAYIAGKEPTKHIRAEVSAFIEWH